MKKSENYHHAVQKLLEAVPAYQANLEDTLYRDGLIQRFEFTVELAWKSLKEYLEDQGVVFPVSSPRQVLKEAFAAGIISDADTWNAIIVARNTTSHIYDEATAADIAEKIHGQFIPCLVALDRFFQ